MKNSVVPTKFHKSLGNVKDTEISEGEILLLRYLIKDTEQQIINYRLKEAKIGEKIKKLVDSIRKDKILAQESREFIDTSKLFETICMASGITPSSGRRKFYKRVSNTIDRKLERRKELYAKRKNKSESSTSDENEDE